MAQKFNLTAQLQLQANQSNINQVVSQVQKQLAPLGNIKLKTIIDGRSLAQASQQMGQFNKYAQSSAKSVGELNRTLAESARRFSVITVATGSLLSLVNAFKKSVSAAIEFDSELVKIEQVTGSGGRAIADLSDEVRRLSTSLGVSSSELIGISRTLLQAGLSAENTKKALDVLAKTTLASSFDDIKSTTEGAIAVLSQFKDLAAQSGGEIKFLEQSLDAINAVSKAFAVESADLVEAIRKVGGIFVNTGGDVNELIALFTSVRATTRESAETIATGLRTIFTRIQRGDTVDALKELGIELRDAEGNFVGAFEAVKRLSTGLSGLDPKSFRFSAIVEELGGYRQIGKVIPLINQFTVAQQALNIAQNANGSINKDVQTSQKALSIQIKKVKEQFDELISKFADSEAFRSIIGGSLKFAEALIKLGSALEPIIPLLTTLFALKAGQGLASGIGILRGFTGAPSGIRASKFASGGMVPGSGNRDTVPAMLTPGEFVIRKSSVNKIGAANLAAMNAKGYAAGGFVRDDRHGYGLFTPNSTAMKAAKKNFTDSEWRNKSQDEKQKLAAEQSQLQQTKKDQIAAQEKIESDKKQKKVESNAAKKYPGGAFKTIPGAIGGFFLNPETQGESGFSLPSNLEFDLNGKKAAIVQGSTLTEFLPFRNDLKKNKNLQNIVDNASKQGLISSIESASPKINSYLDIAPVLNSDDSQVRNSAAKLAKDNQVISTISGYLFEGIIEAVTGAKLAGGQSSFDFPNVSANKSKLARLFTTNESDLDGLIKADAKRSRTGKNFLSIFDKVRQDIQKNNDLRGVQKLAKGGFVQKFAAGTGLMGVRPIPLIDDLPNSPDAIQPRPDLAMRAISISGYGALDVDRTLFRTKGDQAYARAKPGAEQNAVLQKYFYNAAARLQDVRTAQLTQFGKELKKNIESGAVDPKKLFIISKSSQTPGVAEYINQVFGIPVGQMKFTAGAEKVAPLSQIRKTGSFAKFAKGGEASDTVPALLTPGEFVFNKSAAQSIGYSNLNRMNKLGVQGFAKGGPVGVQTFAGGGAVQSTISNLSSKDYVLLEVAAKKNIQVFERLTQELEDITDDPKLIEAALKSFTRNIDKTSDGSELLDKALQAAARQLQGGMGNVTAAMNDANARRDEQKTQSQARANLGVKETRVAGSVGVANLPTETFVKLQAYFDNLGLSVQKGDKAILAYSYYIRQGMSKQDALNKAIDLAKNMTNEDIEASKKLVQEKKSLTSRLMSSVGGVGGAVGGAVGKFAGDTGAALKPAAEATRSLQTLAFFATGIAAVTTQMFGLSGAMEQAINQTVATAATLLSLGSTVLDLASNMSTAAIAAGTDIQKKAAADLAAKADIQEAAASTQAAAADKLKTGGAAGGGGVTAGGVFGSTLLAAAAAAAIVVTVFQGFAAYWTATADDLAKKTENSLGKLAETGQGAAQEIQSTVKDEVEARNKANSYRQAAFEGGIAAAGAAALGAAGAIAFGAAIGSTVPVIGTLIGAAAGLAYGFWTYNSAQKAATEAAQKQAQALNATVDSLVNLSKANADYKNRLNEINNLPISEEKKIGLQLQARAVGAGGQAVGDINLNAVQQSSAFLAEMSQKTGKSLSELTSATDEDLKKIKGINESERVMIKLRSKEFDMGLKTLSQAVADSRATLGQAAQLELNTGNKSFDELIADPTSKFAQALQQNETLIRQEATARRLGIQADIANLQILAQNVKNEQERAAITSQINSMQKDAAQITDSTNKQIEETRNAFREQSQTAIENKKQVLLEIAARKALFVELNKQKETLNKINQFTKGLQDAEAGINDFIANLEGNVARIEIKEVELGDNLPLDQLKSNLNDFLNTTSSLPQELQKAGLDAAKALLFSRDLIAKNSEKLVGLEIKDKGITGAQILKQIGLDDDVLLQAFRGNNEAVKAFQKSVQDAAANGFIDAEEADKLFDPIREANEGFADQIQALNEGVKQQLNVFRANLAAEQAVRDKNIEAADKYNSVVSKSAEILAKARGENVAEVNSRTEIESQQRVLNAGQAGRGGVVLQAGNAMQLAAAKRLAESQLEASRAAIENARKMANNAEEIGKLERAQQQFINTIKDTTAALEEIANSSAEIDKLTESLDKERQAREQAFGVLKEFVIGGQESRNSLFQANQGLLSAIQTGTTQNLPEEVRSSVFSLLDKLSNVKIGQTGLTGEQLSKELIVRDAAMLGVDPQLALELATQTTVEKQILSAIENQTKVLQEVMMAAAPAQVQAPMVQTKSKGGIIYRASGGSIFKPRGTDTVPAMLTPGEFVMNKDAVDKYGIGFMQSLNNGNETNYLAEGGKATKDLTREELEAKIKAKELEEQKKRQAKFAAKQAKEKEAYEARMKTNRQRAEEKRIEEQQSLKDLKAQQAARSEQALQQADADKKRRETENMNQLRLKAEGTTFESLDETQARNILGDEGYQVEKEKLARRKPKEEVEAAKWEAQINRSVLSLRKESSRKRTKEEKRKNAGGINIQNAVTTPTPINNVPVNRGIQVAPQIAPQIAPQAAMPNQIQQPPQQFAQQQVQQIQQPQLQQIQQQAQQAQGINQQQAAVGEQAGGIVGLQGIFETFSGNFQTSIDNMITAFSTIGGSINNLVAAFSAGMTVNHQFSGDMTLAFNIQNGDVLKNQIAEAITPKLKEIITQELDSRLNNFKAGG